MAVQNTVLLLWKSNDLNEQKECTNIRRIVL